MTDISKTRNSTNIIVLCVILLISQQSWAKPVHHEIGSIFEDNNLEVPDEVEEETGPLINLYAILSYADIFFGPEVDNSRYYNPLIAELVASENKKKRSKDDVIERNMTEVDDEEEDEDDDELIETKVNEESSSNTSEVSEKPVTLSADVEESQSNPNSRIKRSPNPQFQQRDNNWGLGGKFGEYRSSEFNKGSAFQNPGFSGLYDQFGSPNKFGKK